MKLLVTGAGGFIGAAVAQAAVTAGHGVVALARAEAPPRLVPLAGRIAYERVDMVDAAGLDRVMQAHRPDVVVHSAWAGITGDTRQQRAQIEDNVRATGDLLDAAARAGVSRFVGIGSQGEYGALDRRITETDLPQPTSLYGIAKLAALHLSRLVCAGAGMSFAWTRLFAAYGPGDNANWLIPGLVAKFAAGERPRTTPGTQCWDYLYIDDAAAGVLALVDTPAATGVFNLSSGEPVEVRRIVAMIRDRVSPGTELVFGEVPFGPNQIMHLEGDPSRLAGATGWRPKVSLDEGLDRTVAALVSR